MSDTDKIRRLIEKYGLEYETGKFDGVTVRSETCWRLRWESNPKEEVVVHSIKEADGVLLRWKEQLERKRGEAACAKLEKDINDMRRG